MRSYWPNDSRFDHDKFSQQSCKLVFEALAQAQKLELERLHKMEMPIAQLTAVYGNSQKAKAPYFKTSDFYLFAPRESNFSPNTCATVLSLLEDKKLPPWALQLAPMEEIEGGNQGNVTKPRMWMVRGLALICPSLNQGSLSATLALVEEDAPSGEVVVFDVDSGDEHTIFVPPHIVDEPYILEVYWECEDHLFTDMQMLP